MWFVFDEIDTQGRKFFFDDDDDRVAPCDWDLLLKLSVRTLLVIRKSTYAIERPLLANKLNVRFIITFLKVEILLLQNFH